MIGARLVLAIALTLSFNSETYGDTVKCPESSTITGVNVDQLLGEWQMVQVIYSLRSSPSRTSEATDCSDLHITSEGDDKLKFTYDDKYTITSPALKSSVITYNVKHVSDDGFTVDSYFDEKLKQDKPELSRPLNSFVRTVVPGKYMVTYICALQNSERIIVSKYLFAKLTDTGLAITEQEKNEIIENIINTNPSQYINSITHNDQCYSRISH